MSKTTVQLVQECANRMGELVLFTGTTLGLTTTVISTGLKKFLGSDAVDRTHAWVWALTGNNAGEEARSTSYAPSTDTLTLLSPGFTNGTASGATYELHRRHRRSRKLEAINSAVRQLGLLCWRNITDTSLTTVAEQYTYTLPAAQNWLAVHSVDIQSNPDLAGAPYVSAQQFNWSVEDATTTAGVRTMLLRFGKQPTPTRVLRVHGIGYYTELVLDADVLPISGPWEGRALEWIMDWAKYRLMEETVEQQPAGQSDRYRVRALDMLMKQKEDIITLMRSHKGGRINVPGMGTGRVRPSKPDLTYFGYFGD